MKRKLTHLILITFIGLSSFSNAQSIKLIDFDSLQGSNPSGSLISDGTYLYGMTEYGGTNNLGVLFKIKPDGTAYSRLLDFTGIANGSSPRGSLISDGTFLYGMTNSGGTNGSGTTFKIKPDGTGYAKLLDFAGGAADGTAPMGSLVSDATFLYGMTNSGGNINGVGTIFKIKPDGTGYSKLLDFDGASNGQFPSGSLISDGNYLYGMTEYGGTNNLGTVFKIQTDGTGYSKLLDFAGVANGSKPFGSLISVGTFLYGMTEYGGTNNMGVLFKIKPDGTGYFKLLDFAGIANGSKPLGSLISDGTFLYGMTRHGGSNSSGTIFKIKPDGTGYVKLLDFAGASNGQWPGGTLISDGTYLYGMTLYGGTSGAGVLFKYALATGIVEKNMAFDFNMYPNPNNGTFTIEMNKLLNQVQHDISIYNIIGKKVYHSQINNPKLEIDLNKQPAGIYFVQINTEQGITNKILIIN
jgi:uncharacterized repeat protein (TIGR03803 family)